MIIFWPTRHPEPQLFKVELYSTTTKRYIVEPRYNEGITKIFLTPVKVKYRKIPKISPGAYIFQRPFLRGLCLEGLFYGGKFAFLN